jgi:4-alpha-glucanotransferase
VFRRIPRRSIASLNTHDMPPFAAFWEEADIREKRGLGLLDAGGARQESRTRRALKDVLKKGLKKKGFLQRVGNDTGAVLRACLAYLGRSPARVVLINIEDLWGETRSQNIPGSGDLYPNWRRKARYAFEDFCRRKDVRDILEGISGLRKKGGGTPRRD